MKTYQVLLFSWMMTCSIFRNDVFAQQLTITKSIEGQAINFFVEPRDPECRNLMHLDIGKLMCLAVKVEAVGSATPPNFVLTKFDANMPKHRHGMVTRARVKKISSSEYLIEGVKLHMAGDWNFILTAVNGKSAVDVAIPLKL